MSQFLLYSFSRKSLGFLFYVIVYITKVEVEHILSCDDVKEKCINVNILENMTKIQVQCSKSNKSFS